MIKHFFPGLLVELPDRADIAFPIRGAFARLYYRISANSDLHKRLGLTHLQWVACVEKGPTSVIGIMVYLNESMVIPLEPDGAIPAKITLDALLRTCHADPQKILGGL